MVFVDTEKLAYMVRTTLNAEQHGVSVCVWADGNSIRLVCEDASRENVAYMANRCGDLLGFVFGTVCLLAGMPSLKPNGRYEISLKFMIGRKRDFVRVN